MKSLSPFRGEPAFRWALPALLACALPTMLAAGLVLWADPAAPVLLIAGGFGAAVALALLQYPGVIWSLALLLSLVPFGLRPPSLDLAYTAAVNGSIALAFASWLLQAGTRRGGVVFGPTAIALVLFLAWAFVTSAWAPDAVEARKKLIAFTTDLILFVVVSDRMRDVRSVDELMAVLRIIGWIMVGCGLYVLLDSGFQFGSRLKVFGTNENEFGLTLVAMIPGAVWPVLRRRPGRRGLMMAMSIAFIVCALMLIALTGSRGSSISLILVLLAFSLSRPMRPWGLAGLAMLSVCLMSAPFVLDSVLNRFADQEGGEFGGRDVLWRAALMLISDMPWTGAGVGNGPAALHSYIASLTNDFNHHANLPSHNPLLDVGSETGVLGIVLYFSACLVAFCQFFGAKARSVMRRPEMAGYFPLVLGVGAGYATSWLKGGGGEDQPTLFLVLVLLVIPSRLAQTFDAAAMPRVGQIRRAVASASGGVSR